jgi:antitoxin YefM
VDDHLDAPGDGEPAGLTPQHGSDRCWQALRRPSIIKNGRPAAILLAIDDFEALEETVEWLADPTTLSDIHEAETCPSVSLKQVRAELQQRRP